MRRMRFVVKGALLALMVGFGVAASGGAATLDSQSYYCFAVGDLAVGIQTLSAAAAAEGYAVLSFSDNTVTIVNGTNSPSDTIEGMLLSANRLLVIDGDRFYLRADGAALSYAIRPSDAGLELVISPKAPIDLVDALTTVFVELQDVAIDGMDVDLTDYRTVVRDPLKGPAEPLDLAAKLDYALYGLVAAEDWFTYASQKGLALLGLRIEVVVEKLPGASLAVDFRNQVISETPELASLILPVDQLASLARSAGVGYVRLPYVPVAP